jgi:hypothetical protein
MIRTLRITSIIVAVAAVFLLIMLAVYGVRKDPAIEELLKAADAVEKFVATRGQGAAGDESAVKESPLIKQASNFARYLNPPAPLTPGPLPSSVVLPEMPQPISPVTAKFDLLGTSYYANRPDLSLALIDEPGKGLSWVRQGTSVGHLVIEEVKDGTITVRDSQKTYEMTVQVKELWRNLLKNPPGGRPDQPAETQPASRPAARAPQSRPVPGKIPAAVRTGRGPDNITSMDEGPRSAIRPARDARRGRPSPGSIAPGTPQPAPSSAIRPSTPGSDKIEAGNESAAGEGEYLPPPPIPTEKDIIHFRLMEEVRASRLTEEEARQIEEAAQTLEQLEELQSRRGEQSRSESKDAEKPKTSRQK